jgi:uncharacterized protein YjhX (UPF0386 family)
MTASRLIPWLLALLLCAGCGGRKKIDPQERQAVAEIQARGGRVEYDETKSVRTVIRVDFAGTNIDDEALEHVQRLTSLETLDLKGTQVTDKGLALLKGLKNLKALYVYRTRVTDAGVQDLKAALPELTVDR